MQTYNDEEVVLECTNRLFALKPKAMMHAVKQGVHMQKILHGAGLAPHPKPDDPAVSVARMVLFALEIEDLMFAAAKIGAEEERNRVTANQH